VALNVSGVSVRQANVRTPWLIFSISVLPSIG
jgi:hypothetical protein